MIIFGTMMAIANGVVLPLMCIVFGDMTDSFVKDSTMAQINITNPSANMTNFSESDSVSDKGMGTIN